MKLYKTEGIIIKRRNIGEADRLITIFSKNHGKLKVIAKGIRKISSRRAGHLEVFGQAEFTLFIGKTFDSVTEVQRKNTYTVPLHDLNKISFAYYLCELVDALLPEKQEQPEVYEQLEMGLEALFMSETDIQCDEIVSSFAIVLLRTLGFLPEHQSIPSDSLYQFIESVIEKKLKTPRLLKKVL